MTLAEFKSTVSGELPVGLSLPLQALWHDARGDWQGAHRVAQDIADATGAWIHAYLHRKEGDLGNAAYWYGRAHQPVAAGPFDREWEQIVNTLLG